MVEGLFLIPLSMFNIGSSLGVVLGSLDGIAEGRVLIPLSMLDNGSSLGDELGSLDGIAEGRVLILWILKNVPRFPDTGSLDGIAVGLIDEVFESIFLAVGYWLEGNAGIGAGVWIRDNGT